jgi:hypothetical protein
MTISLGLIASNTIPPMSANAPTTGGMKWLSVVAMCKPPGPEMALILTGTPVSDCGRKES